MKELLRLKRNAALVMCLLIIGLSACYPEPEDVLSGGDTGPSEEMNGAQESTAPAADKPNRVPLPVETDSNSGVLSSNIRLAQSWHNINETISFLGLSGAEIVDRYWHDLIYYYKYSDGSEKLEIGARCPYFSGTAWEDNSYCIAVDDIWLLSGDISPEEDLRLRFGYDAVQKTDSGNNRYLQYVFDDGIEVRFYAQPDEDNPKSGIIAVKYTDTFYERHAPKGYADRNASDKLSMPNWDKINEYATIYLGKSKEDLHERNLRQVDFVDSDRGIYHRHSESYYDPETGVTIDMDDSICNKVYIRADRIFPIKSEQFTRNELLRFWNDVSFMWGVYEFSAYAYEFEDFTVSIHSNIDGAVNSDEIIMIYPRTYE